MTTSGTRTDRPPAPADADGPAPPSAADDAAGDQRPPGKRRDAEELRSLWRSLFERAAGQRGVVSLACARAVGLDPRRLGDRARREGWRQLVPGAWLVPGATVSVEGRGFAAVLTTPGAVLHRSSAAHLHGLHVAAPSRVEVVRRASAGRRRVQGVAASRSRTLTDDHITEVDGLPVTTLARTLRDLAVCGTAATKLRELMIAARQQHRPVLDELAAMVANESRTPGRPRLLELLAELADDGSDSGLEHLVVARLVEEHLPPDGQQHELLVPGRTTRRGDIAFLGGKVIIECQGFAFHSSIEQLTRDVHRQNDLALLDDVVVLTITWQMFHEEWDDFVALLRQVLAARGWVPGAAV